MKHGNVGKVKLTYISNDIGPEYSDGDVENELLEMFKNGLTEDERSKLLNNNPSWPIRYHLAYERGNLLNWYKFPDGARVLEVGSGCGAITETLVGNGNITIVSNELSERRATINAHRNKNAKNLEIVVGNLQDYKPLEKFDYVICVGVLEYAGTFIDDPNPYHAFLKHLNSFLKPGGRLLLAIENRLGFKYLSGAKEDHTGYYFDGINEYPHKKEVRTFGRKELERLLMETNFETEKFFYPHPDYKLPQIIYSDQYLPGLHTTIPKNTLPSPNYDQTRQHLFSEQMFVGVLESNNIFQHFSNSFLVEAVNGGGQDKSESPIFSITRAARAKEYRIRTTAFSKGSTVYFRKESIVPESKRHIKEIYKTYEILSKKAANSTIVKIAKPVNFSKDDGYIDYEIIRGDSVENHIVSALMHGNYLEIERMLQKYREILSLFSENSSNTETSKNQEEILGKNILKKFDSTRIIKHGILDFNLDNFIVEESTGDWWLIDYEWRLNIPIPVEFIEYRGIFSLCTRHKDIIESRALRQEIISNNVFAIPKIILDSQGYNLNKFMDLYMIEEGNIQPWVHRKNLKKPTFTKFYEARPKEYYLEYAEHEIESLTNSINENEKLMQEKEAQIIEKDKRLDEVYNSFSWRITRPIRLVKHKFNDFFGNRTK